MKSVDANLRFALGTLILVYAFYVMNYYFLIASVVLYWTAYKRFCLVYFLFKINERLSINNFYLTFLPKHNPSPVLIFDYKGEVLFKNSSAHNSIACEHKTLNLSLEEHQKIINNDAFQTLMLECKEKTYQIQLQGISQEKFLLAYFTDVTQVIELNDAIEDTQREIIYAMGEIGETRSKETGNHVKRVAKYSKLLATLYGLDEKEAEMLKMASPMHDIGKVAIPDAILNAPRKLSDEEFVIMKTHAKLGYDMLKNSTKEILKAAAIVAGEHHEKWDGSGYPQGKQGEDIHIFGRITAVADVFDALGSERIYKKAWELERILELFKEQSGKHFDPKLIELFLENLDQFLKIRDKYKDVIES